MNQTISNSRSQTRFYSTVGDIDSIIKSSRLRKEDENNIKPQIELNHINSLNLLGINHTRINNKSEKQEKYNYYVSSNSSDIYNFANQFYHGNQDRNKNIKDINNSDYTRSLNLVGDDKKEWKSCLLEVSHQKLKSPTPKMVLEEMGELKYVEKLNRFDCPITLNPEIASFIEVGIHAILRQRLQQPTVDKHLRYARFMENHIISVDFRNPSFENFIQHMDFREQVEKATPNALKHEWNAMRMFLKAYGITDWNYKLPMMPKSHKRILPFPDVVYKIFHYKYSNDKYENALYQYLFLHSFQIGWRVPSEICEMKVDDVILNGDGTGCLIITETKKHRSQRTIFPNKQLLDSKTHKSFKNWIDRWRPKVENQFSGDALYLWPSGKPLTTSTLGYKLSKYGKTIWPKFQPYDMRHWCAIARLIEQKVKTGTFDILPVKTWLGHEKIETTMNYIRYAEQYYRQAPYDWLKRVLKYHKIMVGENTLNQDNPLEPLFQVEI